MISLRGNKKLNLLLALTIGTASTGIVNQLSAYPQLPTNPTARKIAYALIIGAPSFIRLYTKGTPKELKFKTELDDTWSDCLYDWVEILQVWNILFRHNEYKKLVDKRWIGTSLSLVDKETKETFENGLGEVTTKGKKVECLPTGVCGNFDAYVLRQCKKLFDAMGNIEKALRVYYLLHGHDIENFSEVWLSKKA